MSHIIELPSANNKALIHANYESAKRFHSIITVFFNPINLRDQKMFRVAQSWLDHATTKMIESL